MEILDTVILILEIIPKLLGIAMLLFPDKKKSSNHKRWMLECNLLPFGTLSLMSHTLRVTPVVKLIVTPQGKKGGSNCGKQGQKKEYWRNRAGFFLGSC